MDTILHKLTGTDRRSIGKSNEVAALIGTDPELFVPVMEGIASDDAVLRMRCADVVEKVTKNHPGHLAPYKQAILEKYCQIEQQEVRWHMAQLLPRLELSAQERRVAVEILMTYLEDNSAIVKTFSMQALADLAERDELLKPEIKNKIELMTDMGSPAVKNRGKKLLMRLKADG